MDLKVHLPVTGLFLLTEPALELFGRMGGAIVQDEGHGVDLPSQRFGNDLLTHKGLEIDKAFALPTGAINLAIRHREPGKQMASATAMIAGFLQQRLAWTCWTRRIFALASLNGSFLVETDQPVACSQERSRLGIGLKHWPGSLQEGDRLMDVLPGVVAPGTKAFGLEPATDGAGGDGRKRRVLSHATGQFGSTPAREWHLRLLGQATGDGGDLRPYLRGKNASVPHCGARQRANGS